MPLWRQLTRGLRSLTRRSEADRDLSDEIDHFFAEEVDARRESGLAEAEARRRAMMEVGTPEGIREQVREYGWENLFETMVADARYGVRRLRQNPRFAMVAIGTLAIGIGASTAIFSAAKPILLEPLPYPGAKRLVMIWDKGGDGSRIDVTFGTFRELEARSRAYEALAVMRPWQPTLIGRAEPERLEGQRVSAAYFEVLGMHPALGSAFSRPDDHPNAPPVAIISDALWRRRFGADPSVIGQQIVLDATPHMVLGVMPPTFENVLAPSADIWTPLRYDPSLPLDGREWGHHLRLTARLKPGTELAQAQQELETIAATPIAEFPRPPWAALANGLQQISMHQEITRAIRPALFAVIGAVALLLIITGVNVANVLLARGIARRPEFALRAALGASRHRVVRQVVIESLILAGAGGICGLLIARMAIDGFLALGWDLPRAHAIDLDGTVFGFAVSLSTLMGVLVALVPARQASHVELAVNIQHGSLRIAGGNHLTRRVLVVVEVALALMLVSAAALILRSMQRLLSVPMGFDPTHVLTLQIQTSGPRFADAGVPHRYFQQVLDAVRAVPGVSAAAFTSQLPLTGDEDVYGVQVEGGAGRSDEYGAAFRYAVSPDYLDVMRIMLTRGRAFTVDDHAGRPPVALITESLARSRFPERDPMGQRIRIGQESTPWFTIVGVVADVRQTSLAAIPANAVYVPSEQWYGVDNARWLVVKMQPGIGGGISAPWRAEARFVTAIRQAIWSIDKDQPIVRVAMMDERVAASAAERRFALLLFEIFGAVAVLLAAIGLYGILAGTVAERMREIGIRSALGAPPTAIFSMIVRQGMALTACGLVAGLIAALVVSDILAALLFEISRLDPVSYAGAIAVLIAVAAVACSIPAWRAVRVPATIALVSE